MSKCNQDKPHTEGTVHDYQQHRCRCDPCRKANSAYQRKMKELRDAGVSSTVPSIAARQTLLTWMAEGWSFRDISVSTGLSVGVLHKIARTEGISIYRTTHEVIQNSFSKRPEDRR